MDYYEVNFDGLVGPTHNYAGLSSGNLASTVNANDTSRPREAVQQGLAKMKALRDMGLKQGVLAPQQRPDLGALRQLGFSGSEEQVIEKAFRDAPHILASCYSASSMWTANAATVSPSPDTEDGKVHFTPANLTSKFHRFIEPQTTSEILKAVFPCGDSFVHHEPLPSCPHFGDEGAANHTRFCSSYGAAGTEFFVYGRYAFEQGKPAPSRYPARQTFEASEAVARLHGLDPARTVYAQQNPDVIDSGVFHNDVISVGNRNCYFYHEKALLDQDRVLDQLRSLADGEFHCVEVPDKRVSVQDAVGSYLFNSQLVTLGDRIVLISPGECRENKAVSAYLDDLVASGGPISEVKIYDVKQSMKNGGGPACLRLRVVLSGQELAAVNPATLMNDELFATLNKWAVKHYREEISFDDLRDPSLIRECREALDELTSILKLGSIYPFQKN